MKFKNILFAALVAGAGTAVAQNSATTTQTGAGNTSGVTQSGGSGAIILQNGSSNKSSATQSGGSKADVNQQGASSSSTLTQSGGVNTADIDQRGDGGHTVTATQMGGGGNSLTVDQTRKDNKLTATQDGKNNAAEVKQTTGVNSGVASGGHTATLKQVGDANQIALEQKFGSPNPKGKHTATLSQQGNRNQIGGFADGQEADPSVQESRTDQTATVDQLGDDNKADFTNGTKLDIDQLGSRNEVVSSGGGDVTIYQQGDDNDAFNNGNSAFIRQVGSFNLARSTRQVSGSETSQTQNGNRNSSEFLDLRHSGNVATSVQTGDWNSVTGKWNQGGGNRLTVNQTSDAGATALTGNKATVTFNTGTDEGNNNGVGITQNGLSHVATVTVNSENNMATISQMGNGNTSTITQN